MILPRFELKEPVSTREALNLSNSFSNSVFLAGGTDILVTMKRKLLIPDIVVSLDKRSEEHTLNSSHDV
jgi:CO/xanthine dehydrogenase FAD-binding subunit